MKIMILGLGVIGTTYAYVFQKSGFETAHLIREHNRKKCPDKISVKLLDGRKSKQGEDIEDTYTVAMARQDESYDLIVVSVSGGRLKEAVDTLNQNRIGGTILVLNGVREERKDLDEIMNGRKYILGYPVAGGQIDMEKARLDSVLFGHMMIERKDKAGIDRYDDIISLLNQSGIKAECPHDMLEWIWLHMAINAGVITTAASLGDIKDSVAAARRLMSRAPALREAILTIRECVKVVEARNVDLKNYRNELIPYKIPSLLAGLIMKRMFRTNRLTRQIMELHANKDDLLYVCGSVYEIGKKMNISTPCFDINYKALLNALE